MRTQGASSWFTPAIDDACAQTSTEDAVSTELASTFQVRPMRAPIQPCGLGLAGGPASVR